MGGFAIWPWEVDEITDEWLASFESLEMGLPTLQKEKDDWEARLANFRRQHPTFQKYKH